MKWLIIIALLLLAAAEKIWQIRRENDYRQGMIKRFPGARFHFYQGDHLAIAQTKQQIHIGSGFREGVFRFDQILGVHLNVDGETIEALDKTAVLLGAAAGATTFGHVGALVGALAMPPRLVDTVRRISLHIIVDDPRPLYEVHFFISSNGQYGDDAGSAVVESAYRKAYQWYGRLIDAMAAAGVPHAG